MKRSQQVIDWMEWVFLSTHVNSLSDSPMTAHAALPMWLKNNASATRGKAVIHIATREGAMLG